MPRFFVDRLAEGTMLLHGEDARHIGKSLRMRVGETLTLCDGKAQEGECVITQIHDDIIEVQPLLIKSCASEPSVRVTLYQGVTKGDKMDYIIQKSVELGVHKIVPFLSARCVSRPDKKSAAKKCERWQKISEQAAKQCGRGIIPQVSEILDFDEMLADAGAPLKLVFYEGGGASLRVRLENAPQEIAVFIGPEGGWEEAEVEALESKAGALRSTLGPRILRTETAPLAALAAVMYQTGNMD